jgi:hypothetical protein
MILIKFKIDLFSKSYKALALKKVDYEYRAVNIFNKEQVEVYSFFYGNYIYLLSKKF